jgi:hypothetical protein
MRPSPPCRGLALVVVDFLKGLLMWRGAGYGALGMFSA